MQDCTLLVPILLLLIARRVRRWRALRASTVYTAGVIENGIHAVDILGDVHVDAMHGGWELAVDIATASLAILSLADVPVRTAERATLLPAWARIAAGNF